MSGGITNVLLKMTSEGHQPVLVRVFGDHTDEVIDRESEDVIAPQLFKAGFGSQVVTLFPSKSQQCMLCTSIALMAALDADSWDISKW